MKQFCTSSDDLKRVCVADMWIADKEEKDKQITQTISMVQSNHQNWANCHGYKYAHQTHTLNPSLDPHWTKLYLIKNLLTTECSMVLWIDFDALFMHCETSVEDLLAKEGVTEERMFIFSADTNIINSGVMIFKKSEWTFNFIDTIIAIGPTPNLGMGYENTALAIGLVGCTKESSRLERELCYNRSDYAFIEKEEPKKKKLFKKLSLGLRVSIEGVIDPRFINQVHLISQPNFNSYRAKTARFIVHFPNTHGNKRISMLSRVAGRSKCNCNQTQTPK